MLLAALPGLLASTAGWMAGAGDSLIPGVVGGVPLLFVAGGVWLGSAAIVVVFLLAALLPDVPVRRRRASIAAVASVLLLNPYLDYRLLVSDSGDGYGMGTLFSLGVVLAGCFLLVGATKPRTEGSAIPAVPVAAGSSPHTGG
jgi:asparagine N-glycosylation enzyme membrane subunit Stt3